MEEVDTFLHAEEVAVGDLGVLAAQLDQSSVSILHFTGKYHGNKNKNIVILD